MSAAKAVEAGADTPRWSERELSEKRIDRVRDGIIVIACKVKAQRGHAKPCVAYCTSTYSRAADGPWQVVQHQRTPPTVSKS
ncbi:MAG: hypothetical protein WA979_13300 [Pacificimonas sp.]